MLRRLKSFVQSRIARTGWYQSQLRSAVESGFEPYVGSLDIEGISGRFFYATPQAKEWYDPIKPYAKLEYEWVIDNVSLEGQMYLTVAHTTGTTPLCSPLRLLANATLSPSTPFR